MAREYQGTMAGIGDIATRTNEITPMMTANTLSNIRGFDSGILKNVLSEFSYTKLDNNTIQINAGQATAYNYDGYVGTSSMFTFSSLAVQYHFIYLEWDKTQSPNTFKLKDFNNQNAPNKDDWWQDDISGTNVGIYQMPIWRFTISSTGIVDLDTLDLREFIQGVQNIVLGGKIETELPIFHKGYLIPTESIPTNRILTVIELSAGQQAGTLDNGWYEVELAGGGGGGAGGASGTSGGPGGRGGTGGYIKINFIVPFTVNYKIMVGSGGSGGNYSGSATIGGGGGGGGGSVLDIPQLGILFIATGGGGGATFLSSGGGGGGYGGGGGGMGGAGVAATGGNGGTGGGNAGGMGGSYDSQFGSNGNGMGGGGGAKSSLPISTSLGGSGGGIGGAGGDADSVAGAGSYGNNGGNNINTVFSGGGAGGAGGNGGYGTNGNNGYARLFKLG